MLSMLSHVIVTIKTLNMANTEWLKQKALIFLKEIDADDAAIETKNENIKNLSSMLIHFCKQLMSDSVSGFLHDQFHDWIVKNEWDFCATSKKGTVIYVWRNEHSSHDYSTKELYELFLSDYLIDTNIFTGSPIHDKEKIINLMNGLTPPQMIEVVDLIKKIVKTNE